MTTLHAGQAHSSSAPNPQRSLITRLSVFTGIPTGLVAAIATYLQAFSLPKRRFIPIN